MTGFGPLHETERDTVLLEDVVRDLSISVDAIESLELDRAIVAWERLEACRKSLAATGADLANKIGAAMPEKRHTAPGLTVERHRTARRSNWQSDDLLRVVLDTRSVDPETGEAESQVQIIRDVYGLAGYQARITALKARGVDPDEFCTTEWGGWSLRPYKGDSK